MLKSQCVLGFLVFCLVISNPSVSLAVDSCAVRHDRWTVRSAFNISRSAFSTLETVPNCYGDNWAVCREVNNDIETARDHLTQVIMISRGTNCKYCNLIRILGLGDDLNDLSNELYSKGYKSAGEGFAEQYAAIASEPYCIKSGTWRNWGHMELQGVSDRMEGTYSDTYQSAPGEIILQWNYEDAEWVGSWGEPAIGRMGTLYGIEVSDNGKLIKGKYDTTKDGGKGLWHKGAVFTWKFVR